MICDRCNKVYLRGVATGDLHTCSPPPIVSKLEAENESLRHDNARLVQQAADMATELAAAQKDASRYRWIRDNHETDPAAMWIHGNVFPDHWDAEIDAALAAKGK